MAPRRNNRRPPAPVQDPNPLEHGSVMPSDDGEEAELARQAEEDQNNPPVSIETLQRDMLAMERRHAEEVANLRRSMPPPRPADPPPADLEPIDQLLFTEPKKAVERLRAEIRREVEGSLTAKYTQDQNTQKFWTQFDGKFPDLKDERDIVETILNKNLDTLANVPVEDAMDKLAELTRARLSRYTKTRPRGSRAFAEGASSPAPPRQEAEDEAPPSLSEIVRRRRAARMNRTTVA